MDRHRHTEWLKFLRLIDESIDEQLDVHLIALIADNYATHKHAKVQRWLKRHPRFHMHFTPTSSSWLNMVERCLLHNIAPELLPVAYLSLTRKAAPGVDDVTWRFYGEDLKNKLIVAERRDSSRSRLIDSATRAWHRRDPTAQALRDQAEQLEGLVAKFIFEDSSKSSVEVRRKLVAARG
jgi:transposase